MVFFLSQDAVPATAPTLLRSDRAARRFCDRLGECGAVRVPTRLRAKDTIWRGCGTSLTGARDGNWGRSWAETPRTCSAACLALSSLGPKPVPSRRETTDPGFVRVPLPRIPRQETWRAPSFFGDVPSYNQLKSYVSLCMNTYAK